MSQDKQVEMPLLDIILDDWLQPRNDVSNPHVRGMRDTLRMGQELPPMMVCQNNRLIGGWHRYFAHLREHSGTVIVMRRHFEDDAERLAVSIGDNSRNGRPYDPYDQKRNMARLREVGKTDEEISQIIIMPLPDVEDVFASFGLGRNGKLVPNKNGLNSVAGKKVTKKQQKAIESHSGMTIAWHAFHIVNALESGLAKITPRAIENMDKAMDLWLNGRDDFIEKAGLKLK
jgi:hypothetical protein